MAPPRDLYVPPRSAIPTFYYVAFGVYEPLMVAGGLIGTILDPAGVCIQSHCFPRLMFMSSQIHNQQAPWPAHMLPPPELPAATVVTVVQYSHVCSLIGLINYFVLTMARRHLASQPALQEQVARALLTPLLIGDLLHIILTLWALGDTRWDVSRWTGMLWSTVVLGLGLFVPRLAWHLGIGRYVHKRDGRFF